MKRGILIGVLVLAVILAVVFVEYKLNKSDVPEPVHIEAEVPGDIIAPNGNEVEPVIYHKVPDLSELKLVERKQAFINIMLPSILLVKDQIERDRQKIMEIIEKGKVEPEDTAFVNEHLKIYKVKSVEELPGHMVCPPPSIVLAQAAIESGWGTSRFFKEGNNVFGMWSYSENQPRIPAGKKRGDRQVYVRKFPSIYASVLNYVRTIGRLNVYADFRKSILEGGDPYNMVDHLIKYSERRGSYVETVKTVMRKNELTMYDDYVLLAEQNTVVKGLGDHEVDEEQID